VAGLDRDRAGTGYLVAPPTGHGPGVLVLHAWWGLNDDIRAICDRLADAGFVALAPDLFDGAVTDDPASGERLLADADPNELAHVTRSGLHTLRSLPIVTGDPVGLVGLSMGASLAVWLSARVPAAVGATSIFYGTQDIDLALTEGAYQGHFADHDEYVDDDQLVLLEAELRLLDREVEFYRYPGTRHWFLEASRPEHDELAAELAWTRTIEFLRRHLDGPGADYNSRP
jgi:carboxymethylenebutenolidase